MRTRIGLQNVLILRVELRTTHNSDFVKRDFRSLRRTDMLRLHARKRCTDNNESNEEEEGHPDDSSTCTFQGSC